jgi:hypothetical protein
MHNGAKAIPGRTYQSPPVSDRDELALLPAAAEAKVGAIRSMEKRLSSRRCAVGAKEVLGALKVERATCGDASTTWRAYSELTTGSS